MTRQTLVQIGAGLSLSVVMSLSLVSCQDDISDDSHYQSPDFLAGNALEVLQQSFDGHTFETFLRGVELIGYNDIVDSQILTVLAPTDEAFAQFLKEKGYASIDEMYQADPTYTNQVITYHLLYYAMDWDKMTNFRPNEGDGATEAERAVRAGMYNRFRTRCVEDTVHVKNTNPEIEDSILTVVHYDRYLTVFSEQMFATLGIDAASNYNYFFPNTEWNPKHLANGFNVMNAAVLDTVAVVTDNGYLYHIDHVIEPAGTLYEEISARSNYQLIKKLFDAYKDYKLDEVETSNRGYNSYYPYFKGLDKSNSDQFNIASEWASTSYLSFTANCFRSTNLFIPTDEALNRIFSQYWETGCGYDSVMGLNKLIQSILLRECIGYITYGTDYATSYMCYPDYLRQGNATSYFGTKLQIDPSTFDANLLCNNGVIYGSTMMDLPGVFNSVAGPAFKNVAYLPYLYALDGAEMLLSLSSQESDFIALIPDSSQFAHSDPAMRLFSTSASGTTEYSLQQWNDESGDYIQMGSSDMLDMVNMNTSTSAQELKTKGTQVVETNVSFNYWYIKDGQITTNALFNQQLNPSFNGQIWASFKEITPYTSGGNWSNGKAYSYSYPSVFMSESSTSLEKELSQNNDRNYPYYCFVQLLQKAGLVDKGKFSGMLMLDTESPRFFAIIPTNDAIKESLTALPGCSKLKIDESTYAITGSATKTTLAKYLLSYFVMSTNNVFTSYPYLGSTCNGTFQTAGSYNLNISDNGDNLSVNFTASSDEPEGNSVQLVNKYDYLPFAFSDGAFQLIDTVLK